MSVDNLPNEITLTGDDIQKTEEYTDENKNSKLIFFAPLALRHIHKKSSEITRNRYTSIGEKSNMSFKMIKSDSKLVKTILFSYGFLQCSSKNQNCNLFWTNTHVGPHVLRSLRPWQRINHFPRSFMITKKDTLYESIDRAAVQYGSWFDFIPEYFCTPLTDVKWEELKKKCREIERKSLPPFIVKPACSSRGRNIVFLNGVEDLKKLNSKEKLLISRYIDRPFLINNLKCDLRVYVMVSSFYPLIVYIYSDGLARFAVHEYNEENRKNYEDTNAHLTNYSLNKTSSCFIKNRDCFAENIGHKWTLGALLREMEKQNVDTRLLMVRIEDIVIKTLLSSQGLVAASCRKFNIHPKCCFELFGFDILIDENLKPWLLEVNLSPSLACDAPLDSVLKTSLICDTLNIASIPLVSERNILNHCATNEDGVDDEVTVKDDVESTFSISSMPTSSSVCSKPSTSDGDQGSFCDGIYLSTDSDRMVQQHLTNSNSKECPTFPLGNGGFNNNGSKKRRLINTRVSKVRKAQYLCKPSFSASSVNAQYLARSKCHFEKLQTEMQRKGHFIRIFPRTYTYDIYSLMLDDVGQEKWDKDLHDQLHNEEIFINEGINFMDLTVRDVTTMHAQLLDAKKYPTCEDLSPIVRDVILKQALSEADRYRSRLYNADIKPYPSSLPIVRQQARRRTKSQVVAEDLRKARLLFLKKEQTCVQELINGDAISTVNEASVFLINGHDQNPMGGCDGDMDLSSVLKPFNDNVEENNLCNGGQSTALAEVSTNFIIKKRKDGKTIVLDHPDKKRID